MNKIITLIIVLSAFMPLNTAVFAQQAPARYWQENLPLTSFRLPPPPVGAKVVYKDLDGDGDPDLLQTVTRNDFPVQWIDDDDDMQEGDWAGDTDSDCLMIDRDRDGIYGGDKDLIVDWNDEDGDGDADMQVVADQVGRENNNWWPGHYMIVIDSDHDQIFNYIDWDTFELECWDHSGSSRFYEDYIGQSLFLKVHASSFTFEDLRLNWENPFLFYDPDGDGQTEYAIRMMDNYLRKSETPEPLAENPAEISDEMRNVYVDGKVEWVSIGWDMDNDAAPASEFDFDMSLRYTGKGFDYRDQVHAFKSMKGLEGTDELFYDARFRQIEELIYPDHEAAHELIYEKSEWEKCWFVFDEDDDCHRWERVEFYDPMDLYKAGARGEGLDHNPQADVVGDRGEWDEDFSGKGQLYVGAFDGKIHLYGAEWGAWRIDQDSKYYQGWQGWRTGNEAAPGIFPVIRYEDQDNNGFIDKIQYDLDGDQDFDHELDFKALGVSDEQSKLDPALMAYEDMEALFKKVARASWQRAQAAVKTAEALGIDTNWYANYKQVHSLREQYHFGYWLNFYLYMDMRDWAMRMEKPALLKLVDKAYLSGDWSMVR